MKRNLSIVLPMYNEEANISRVVQSVLQFVPRVAADHEVILVDDGSRDRTGELADGLAGRYQQVYVVHHPQNRGYGAALRSGFARAHKNLVFFMDSDGQFDIRELPGFLALLEDTDMVCGYRLRRADSFVRKLIADIYHLAIKALFGLRLRDIDCAFKVFRREIIDAIPLESDGALISAELLILAAAAGYRITEMGVHHYPRTRGQQTGANPLVILRAVRELLRFQRRFRREQLGDFFK